MAASRDRHAVPGLAALYEVGRRLASTQDLGMLLSQIAEVTRGLVDYQTFAVFLLDPDGKHLVPRYTQSKGKWRWTVSVTRTEAMRPAGPGRPMRRDAAPAARPSAGRGGRSDVRMGRGQGVEDPDAGRHP